ncbi:hypothetical protein QBC34DRAFT_441136 [Podospora aff. communis PSN243]|uniref:Uncharacterized protein n=1 Tax=Podospora aff. communis PSN243 TaxID=3040156 RepID=A0AAV9GE70_9PEZI|nr:hypothetical protein QBC34DRAFT_441136 [Podospora aff. communis PSN243]
MSATNPEVYIGAWRSYQDGTAPALILTLKEREALILIAALVVFIGFVASQVFGAVRFILHQKRLHREPSPGVKARRRPTRVEPTRDGLHEQQQALLRNTSSHIHTLWLAGKVAWAWKGRLGTLTALRRSMVIMVVTGASLAAWTTAQLLLPWLWTEAKDQMLTALSSCDEVIPPHRQLELDNDSQRMLQASHTFNRYYSDMADTAASFLKECPGNSTRGPACERIPFPRVGYRTVDGDSCPLLDCNAPFTNAEHVEWVSDFLNSNAHLGINAPPEETVDFQHILSCVSADLSSVVYDRSAGDTSGVYRYNWGNTTIGETLLPYTVLYNESLTQSGTAYQITSFTNYTNYKSPLTPLWSPNTTLFEPFSEEDRIRTIHFFAANSVTYPSPVLDPLFRTSPFPEPSPNPPPVYLPANPVTVLICRETHNFCSPTYRSHLVPNMKGYCAPRGLPTKSDEEVFEGPGCFSEKQKATARRIRNLVPVGGIASVVQALDEPLMAGRTAVRKVGGFGAGWEQRGEVPVDQWKREVTRWFEVGLVMLQMGFFEGGEREEVRGLVVERTECGMQRVGGVAGVKNLNLVGIVGTVGVGVFLVLLSWVVKPVVGWWQRRKSRGGQTGVMQWKMDGLFQIQRAAYEAAGVRGWDDRIAAVPTTAERVFPKDVMRMRATF